MNKNLRAEFSNTEENEHLDETRRLDVKFSEFTLKFFKQCDIF